MSRSVAIALIVAGLGLMIASRLTRPATFDAAAAARNLPDVGAF